MVSGDSNAARLLLAAVDDPGWREEVPRLALGLLGRLQRGPLGHHGRERLGDPGDGQVQPAPRAGHGRGDHDRDPRPGRKAVDWAEGKRPPTIDFPWPGDARETLGVNHEGQGRPWAFVQSRAAIPLAAP